MNPISTTELQPIYENVKGYYRKAYVHRLKDTLSLQSYDTMVCDYNMATNELRIFGEYSKTTLRHIREFIQQFTGLGYLSLKEIRAHIGLGE